MNEKFGFLFFSIFLGLYFLPNKILANSILKKKSNYTIIEKITGIKFKFVQSGFFEIGDQFSEGSIDERKTRKIKIKSFFLAETETTQKQWEKIMKWNRSRFKRPDYPISNISWYQVQEFINNLNLKYQDRYIFRLPTEAEWEYACREKGGQKRYCNGKNIAKKSEINFDNNGPMAVASFPPNSLGIYDMSGNLREWT